MKDMIPPGDRSIRNIPVSPSHRHASARRSPRPVENSLIEEEEIPSSRRGRRRMYGWLAAAVVLLGAIAGLLLSTLFAGATITVYPRRETVEPPSTLRAQLNAPVGTLAYQTMTVTRPATTSVPATGMKQVSRAASGTITIYNAYSTASQRLIANTRFQAPEGKIYRIRESITVPGATKASDGTLTPGSIATIVYADSPGAEYNRGASTRFTIPGFQGDPRYSKFYAESKGSIGSGFVGEEPAVSAANLAAARSALEQQLDALVRATTASGIPEGFLALQGSLAITYADVVQTPGQNNTALLAQNATAEMALVRTSNLASAIARYSVSDYKGEAVLFADSSALTLTLATSSSQKSGTLTLLLQGSPTLVWQFDQEALVLALLGKDKQAFETVIQSFEPAIARADARVRPFWSGSFPANPQKITVRIAEE